MTKKRKNTDSDRDISVTAKFAVLIFLPLLAVGNSIIFLFKLCLRFFSVIIVITARSIKFISEIFRNIIELLRKFKFNLPAFKSKTPLQILYQRKKQVEPVKKSVIIQKLREGLKNISVNLKTFFLKVKYFLLGAIFVSLIYLGLEINSLINSLPNPLYLTQRDIPSTTKLFDRNGKLLYEIYSSENRTPFKLADIPDKLIKATIATEDKEFFTHKGFSPKGIIRAIIHNINSGSLEGGSTITQQLVRSALLTPEKTWQRKLKEIVLSVWTEKKYTKEQILEMYLNQVPYGGTAWGIEAASHLYFDKGVKDINTAEAAFLAGLPAAPSGYSPFNNDPQLSLNRQKEVLNKMLKAGFINHLEKEEAEKFTLTFKKPYIPILAPHFVMYVKNLLEEYYGPRLVEQGGLRVTTTLDMALQSKVQEIVRSQIDTLSPLHVTNGAALVTNPKSGEILAMIGSKDYFSKEISGNVNIATSLRQPGSSIKVVNYATALSQGYTAATYINDSAISFNIPGQPAYRPVNYDGNYHGFVTLRTALASSYNIPAVRVLNSIGVDKMIEQGKLMGISSWQDDSRYGLSLTLGGGEVTMLDMASVYGTIANQGITNNLTPLLKISNWKGEDIPLPDKKSSQKALLPGIAYILSDILSDNQARSPAFGNNSLLYIPGKTVAVKTGTSDNKRDNWTIGFTPDYVTTVWVGNNDNSPMDPRLASGVTGAAPIWHEIMATIIEKLPDKPFNQPEDITILPCFGRNEYFLRGTEPKNGCPKPPALPTSKKPPEAETHN